MSLGWELHQPGAILHTQSAVLHPGNPSPSLWDLYGMLAGSQQPPWVSGHFGNRVSHNLGFFPPSCASGSTAGCSRTHRSSPTALQDNQHHISRHFRGIKKDHKATLKWNFVPRKTPRQRILLPLSTFQQHSGEVGGAEEIGAGCPTTTAGAVGQAASFT